ncbi:unnamed protein product [Urochloa humidicola]
MALGDPDTRPDEETVFVPNSFDLEHDARDWESCTLVPWALHLPRGAGAQEIEDLLLDKLELQCGDITVTVHQPEPYLIRFEHSAHCDEARRRGRFSGRGVEICLRRWQSLTHAFGMRIFFRVRLYLDGIPEHAWTPNIVEHVIGRTCALQCINTDLVQPLDTRHIDLWAWTANPSAIPKKVSLVFTHRPSDRSTARVVVVNERYQPERWQQGVRYVVFIHIGLVEDYTAAASDLQGAVANPGAFAPVRRPYVWRYGLEDGAPADARSRYPARLPRPPPVDARGAERGRDTDAQDARGAERGRDTGVQDTRGAERGRDTDAHRRLGHAHAERDGSHGSNGAPRPTAHRSCRDADFVWPGRRDNDDDDDYYDHPGRGGEATRRAGQRRADDSVRRERTRSPRRRDADFRGGRRHAADEDGGRPCLGGVHTCLRSLAVPLPDPDALVNKTVAELQHLFKAKADELKITLQQARGRLSDAWLKEATDFINKACGLAGRMGLVQDDPSVLGAREAAWSDMGAHLIPSSVVFDRIKRATAPSMFEVEQALRAMEFNSKTPAAAVAASTAAADLTQMQPTPGDEGINLGLDEAQLQPTPQAPVGPFSATPPPAGRTPTHEDGGLERPTVGRTPGQEAPTLLQRPSVAELFASPPPAVLPAPPPRTARQRRIFDMTALRRSARLASKKRQPPVQCAQQTLFRKLGLPADELRSIDEVRKEFVSMFTGPLPEHIMAAMTAVFDLDSEEADDVTNALLMHADEAVDEIEEGLQASSA